MLIITDTGAQIRRMLQFIAAIDLPRSGTQTWIEPVHYANASELAARLLEIFPADIAPRAAAKTAKSRRQEEGQPRAGSRWVAVAADRQSGTSSRTSARTR